MKDYDKQLAEYQVKELNELIIKKTRISDYHYRHYNFDDFKTNEEIKECLVVVEKEYSVLRDMREIARSVIAKRGITEDFESIFIGIFVISCVALALSIVGLF